MKSVPQPQLSHNQMVGVCLTVNSKQSPNAILSIQVIPFEIQKGGILKFLPLKSLVSAVVVFCLIPVSIQVLSFDRIRILRLTWDRTWSLTIQHEVYHNKFLVSINLFKHKITLEEENLLTYIWLWLLDIMIKYN